MRLRQLAPYAITALAIALGSSAAVLGTAGDMSASPARPETSTAQPTLSAARSRPELSAAARLAFWRDAKLWVSDLDGSLRQALATTNDPQTISLTRWSTDGNAVSFVEDGLSLAVIRTDGRRQDVPLGSDLRSLGYRIADVRWSPDGRYVAATLLRSPDGRSDAFVADLSAAAPQWRRLTQLEDLFIGGWISSDELLGSTVQGAVVAVSAGGGVGQVRLLAGVTGASPIVTADGRIHFLAGRVPITRDPALPFVTASAASVWSAAPDGSDVRREAPWQLSDVRLDGRLADGRYLVHRGSGSAQGIAGEKEIELLPAGAGLVERVRVSPDGRIAYGFALERIVRIDLAKMSAGAAAGEGAVSVFLDTTGGSDVWFPAAPLPSFRAPRVAGPSERYAFALGGHVWQMQDGIARLLRPAGLIRRSVPPPRWAPDGGHLAVLEAAGPGATPTALIAVSIGPGGEQVRLGSSLAAARSFAWSPDGHELAIAVDRRGLSGVASDADLEVRFLAPNGAQTRAPVRGTEVTWSRAGLFVLTTLQGIPVVAAVDPERGPARIVALEQLLSDPRAESSPVAATIAGLDSPADGEFLSVRLQISEATANKSYLVLLTPRGDRLSYVRADNISDAAWAPRGGLLGYTLDARTSTERAVIVSPAGDPVATVSGRFAGWSSDGRWYHVTRTSGLFAYPVSAGAGEWVGPGGAPISATGR